MCPYPAFCAELDSYLVCQFANFPFLGLIYAKDVLFFVPSTKYGFDMQGG